MTVAAVPAVLLSALAFAAPAQAAPAAPSSAVLPGLSLQAPAHVAPATRIAPRPAATVPAVLPAAPATHRIQPGDTVTAIAARYGLSVADVLAANNLRSNSLIFPGKDLLLGAPAAAEPAVQAPAPSSAAGTYTVKRGDTLGGIAAANGVSLQSVLQANNLTMTSVIQPGQSISFGGGNGAAVTISTIVSTSSSTYTVKAGDTLTAIAAAHQVSLGDLLSANNIGQNSLLHPGDRLSLPGAAGTAPTDLVPSTFLHYTYPDDVVASANLNKQALNAAAVPDRAQMQQIVSSTALQMGVDPALAMAFAQQESGFDHRAVSPANAIGTMQVIPTSGDWASDLVGRQLNLLDPYDNATAGVAIIRSLLATSDSLEVAVASYYQGQHSVVTNGMFSDTENYVASVLAHQASFL